ncbi:MAG: hypothetical protein IT323_05085, partial [Anaerolineae bacterium]|nr:hypothetical protein [Anaerolineae bacterium]
YMLIGWVAWAGRGVEPPLTDVRRAFEWALSLSGGLAAAHLMTIEREEGFDELRRTYAERAWRAPMLRALGGCMAVAGAGLLAALLLYLAYGQYDFSQIVLPAFAPAFYLCGLALLVNNVSGSYWIAAGAVAAYWYGELQTAGYYSRALFLFNHTMPLADIDPHLNRGLLLIGAFLFFTLNAAVSAWRRRRGAVGR